jgi:hypothetical protein
METPKLFSRPSIPLVALIGLVAAACSGPAPATPTSSPAPSATPSAATSPSAPSPSASASPSPEVRVVRAAQMLRPRTGFDSVVLGDGSVLAVGDDSACLPGPAEPGSETAERYDAATDTWTAAESLNNPRKSFATVVTSDGRALVLGGTNANDELFSSTKLFDPATGRWSDGPLLDLARADPVAATLADGRVLTGSTTIILETSSTTTTEILDAAATAWAKASPVEGLSVYSFTALTEGLLAVGDAFEIESMIVLFDPADDAWVSIDSPAVLRQLSLVALDDGGALAFGYEDLAVGRSPSVRVERFDPATRSWGQAAPMSTPRADAMAVRLADGRVLVAGGATSDEMDAAAQALATTEIYDPDADRWSAGPDLLEPRKDGHALLLEDGSVLIHGGDASFNTEGDVPWCPEPMTSAERVYLGS